MRHNFLNFYKILLPKIFIAILSSILIIGCSKKETAKPIDKRGRGMALYGSFVGLGLVAGPFIGSFFSQINFHLSSILFDFTIDKYTIPFLLSGLFSIAVSIALLLFLKEPQKALETNPNSSSINIKDYFKKIKWSLKDTLAMLLVLSFISQFSLAMFEGTFAIHSQRLYNFDL